MPAIYEIKRPLLPEGLDVSAFVRDMQILNERNILRHTARNTEEVCLLLTYIFALDVLRKGQKHDVFGPAYLNKMPETIFGKDTVRHPLLKEKWCVSITEVMYSNVVGSYSLSDTFMTCYQVAINFLADVYKCSEKVIKANMDDNSKWICLCALSHQISFQWDWIPYVTSGRDMRYLGHYCWIIPDLDMICDDSGYVRTDLFAIAVDFVRKMVRTMLIDTGLVRCVTLQSHKGVEDLLCNVIFYHITMKNRCRPSIGSMIIPCASLAVMLCMEREEMLTMNRVQLSRLIKLCNERYHNMNISLNGLVGMGLAIKYGKQHVLGRRMVEFDPVEFVTNATVSNEEKAINRAFITLNNPFVKYQLSVMK